MKQNEKILVYAVTGFLVVILAVAILFGKEVPRRGPGDLQLVTDVAKTSRSLEDIMNERAGLPAPPVADANAGDPVAGDPAAMDSNGGDPNGGTAGGTAGEAAGETAGEAAPPESRFSPVGEQPLVANVQILPPTAAALVTEKLGLSREERGFRIVRARPGDTLGRLVQQWCGELDYLEQAQGLNETLTTLRVGQEVVLPWIDDEVLLAALDQRGAAPTVGVPTPDTGRDAGPTPAVGAAPSTGRAALTQATLRRHKVVAGDSLWRIAEREVGRKQVPRFLDQVRELNPGLDTDRIREGQEILLPARK